MKVFESTECIGKLKLDEAFDLVFGSETFKRVYPGDGTEQSEWANDERTSKFTIDLGRIPMELRMFACDRHLRVDCRQRRERQVDLVRVDTRFKMHFVGSGLFSVRPTFTLFQGADDDKTFMKVHIEHRARLPLPFNQVVEVFMRGCSRNEVERNRRIIQARVKEHTLGSTDIA
jgi:hypothetical protein